MSKITSKSEFSEFEKSVRDCVQVILWEQLLIGVCNLYSSAPCKTGNYGTHKCPHEFWMQKCRSVILLSTRHRPACPAVLAVRPGGLSSRGEGSDGRVECPRGQRRSGSQRGRGRGGRRRSILWRGVLCCSHPRRTSTRAFARRGLVRTPALREGSGPAGQAAQVVSWLYHAALSLCLCSGVSSKGWFARLRLRRNEPRCSRFYHSS